MAVFITLALAATAAAQGQSIATDEGRAEERVVRILEDGAFGERSAGVWSSFSYAGTDDDRPGEAREVESYAYQIGMDRNFVTPYGQVLLGAYGGYHRAHAVIADRNARIASEGLGGGLYGAYSPYLFLSFPFSVGVTAWRSEQTRDGTPSLPVYESEFDSLSINTSVGAMLTLPLREGVVMSAGVRHFYSTNDREAYLEDISGTGINFIKTPSERSQFSRLQGDLRLTYLFDSGRAWAGIGYAYDLEHPAKFEDRDLFPISLGFNFDRGPLSFNVSASTLLGWDDISQYAFSAGLRYRF
jgi:hypothetical protein